MNIDYRRRLSLSVIIFLVIFILDQFIKWRFNSLLRLGESIQILPFLDLVLLYNRGFSFGLASSLPKGGTILLTIIIGIFCLLIMIWLIRELTLQDSHYLSLVLIAAGGWSNFTDRLFYGHVIDWIELHLGEMIRFPVFNLADFMITMGAILLLVFKGRRFNTGKKKNNKMY